MQKTLVVALAAPLVLASCNAAAEKKFDVVSVRPIYGWVDGCADVAIGGKGFTEGASVQIGGAALTGITMPDDSEPLNVGYRINGRTSPGPQGYADVVVTNGDGETGTLDDAFYYVACLGDFYPESARAQTDNGLATSGTTVNVSGCNLNTTLLAQVGDAAPVPLTEVCGTGIVSFAAPDLAANADGYPLVFVNGDGDVVWPPACDTADTGASCTEPLSVRYGGAE